MLKPSRARSLFQRFCKAFSRFVGFFLATAWFPYSSNATFGTIRLFSEHIVSFPIKSSGFTPFWLAQANFLPFLRLNHLKKVGKGDYVVGRIAQPGPFPVYRPAGGRGFPACQSTCYYASRERGYRGKQSANRLLADLAAG